MRVINETGEQAYVVIAVARATIDAVIGKATSSSVSGILLVI
jgi:hypothetical protein